MNKYKLFFASTIANIFEWYDYALFAHLAPIIGIKFFPSINFKESMLYAFLIFAIGYLMRPIGGIFFGRIGDKFGRKKALTTSILFMSIPTALIGLMPTYNEIGIVATIAMLLIRMLQGLSMGGALTGSISFIIEHSKSEHRGLTGSISMSSICIGILLGSMVSNGIETNLSSESFNMWGWRIPFLLGILIAFSGFYIRKYTIETPIFKKLKDAGEIINSPIKYCCSKHWRSMIISIFINSTGSVIFYLQAIYIISYLKINRNISNIEVTNLSHSCYLVIALSCIFGGYLSDKIGRKKIFFITLSSIILSIYFLIDLLEKSSMNYIILTQFFLAILTGLYIGPEPALQAELYPPNIRNTALSLSYNIATSLFGGTTPLIIELLVQKTASITNAAYYVILCSMTSIIAMILYKKESYFK